MNDFVFTSLHNDEDQLPVGGRVSWTGDCTLRVRMMLYPVAMDDVAYYLWDYNPAPQGVTLQAKQGDRSVEFCDKPLRLQISRDHRVRLAMHIDKWSRRDRKIVLRIDAQPGTRFYGLGGQFLGLEHSGKTVECESTDPWGEHVVHEPYWSNTYYPTPLLITSEGYALLLSATVPMRFQLPPRDAKDGCYRVEIASAALDFYFIDTADTAEVLREYLAVTGRPYVPPRWAMEPLLGHGNDNKGKCFQEKVLCEYLDRMQSSRLPNGLIIDEAWSWASKERDEHGAERLWFHPEFLGDFKIHNFQPEDAGIKMAHAAGRKYILHISPFIGNCSEYSRELLAKGCLVMRASDPSLPLVGQYHHYFLDFTNPDAVAWFQQKIRRLVLLGADGFFADFGESDDQRDALYYRGTGATRGQEYSLLYRKAVAEVCREVRGGDFYFISRAGWTGMQQYAASLIGDQPGTFEGMSLVCSAMQCLSMSGQAVSTHNIGGYTAGQEKTVYLRWVQLGVVSPMFSMWNNGYTGEPWTFDEETVTRYRESAELRMRLLPYLHSCLCEFPETGLPLVRPMAMLFPNDPVLADLQDQFLCGSEILAAPIFSKDGARNVCLPTGQWIDFWNGEIITGGREIHVMHPLETFPLFVRCGGIVPMEVSPVRAVPGRDDIELRLYGPGDNHFRLYDHGRICDITTRWSGSIMEITLDPLVRPFVIVRGYALAQPASAEFTAADNQSRPLAVLREGTTWTTRIPASGGRINVQFTSKD